MLKKTILIVTLLIASAFSVGAYAGYTISDLVAATIVGASDLFLIRPSGGTQDKKITASNLISTIVSAGCSLNTTVATTCAKQFGYADPRWFGAYCSTNFNVNNNTQDDTAGIQAALNSNVPVMIPYPGCKLATKLNFTADNQTIFSFASGGQYNHDYRGNPYIFLPNDLWTNRATSLNCAVDTKGYDNVTLRNIAFRANYGLVGSVAVCNSVGILSPRAAAFLNLENVMFGNMGNGVGAAMESYYDYDGSATDSITLGTGSQSFTTQTAKLWTAGMKIRATATGISPSTYMDGTVTSYDSGTGALVINVTSTTGTAGTYASWTLNSSNRCVPITTGSQAVLNNNVFQVRGHGVDFLGSCFGMYGNFSDLHLTDIFGASIFHNVMSTLPGYAGSWDVANARFEYSGFGAGPTGQETAFNDGVGLYYDSPLGVNATNVTCDHQYGGCIAGGPNAKMIQLNNIMSMGSYYGTKSYITNQCHFWFAGSRGITANNVSTIRNSVNTPYVACFKNGVDTGSVTRTPDYINWNGSGGAATSSGAVGQWQTAYFLLTNIGSNFSYNVPGVGIQMSNITGYTETEYNIGNSSTAFTISLDNGTFQKVTATGNATVTMPTATAGKSFTLRYYTGAGSFTATFTGVKWSGGTAPTLTTTASRMDIMSFVSDGTNWYGTYTQNYTP